MEIREIKKKGKVGLMVCGHKEYWPQFPEMKGQFLKNAADFEALLASQGVEVVTFTNEHGEKMVDTVENGYAAGLHFAAEDVDILFLYQTAYVASGRYMQGLKQLRCPVVIVGYQKTRDLATATIYEEHAGGGACPLPEAYNALTRSGIEPAGLEFGHYLVPGFDDRFTKNISEWCRVANCLRAYKGAILGHLGHTYEGMLDMNFDPTTFTRTFGVHIKMLEMCEFAKYVREATDAEVKRKIVEMRETFEFMDPSYDPTTRKISDEDVEWTARVSVGLDQLVQRNNLSGLAYYYEGLDDNEYERVASNMIIGNSLLTSKGVSLAGESDMKTCMSMFTTSSLGCGGSFAEFCSTLFDEDIIMVGHDGPHDIRISDAKPQLRALGVFHGKKGSGLSVDFSLQAGPITMLGLSSDIDGHYSFSVAEGTSKKGIKPQNGNTQTRGDFGPNVAEFVEDWAMSGINHHFSLSVGHNASLLKKLAKTLHIPFKLIR